MEEEEENYPNFGSAYPTTATDAPSQSASWNPALRSDNVDRVHTADGPPESDDEFYQRYPDATPKKQQQRRSVIPSLALESAHDEYNAARRQSISVQHVLDITHDEPSAEDLSKGPRTFTEAEGPITHHEHDEEEGVVLANGAEEYDDEEQVFRGPNESIAEQEHDLKAKMPDIPLGQAAAVQQVAKQTEQTDHAHVPPPDHEEATHPEERYEHQGEVTEMEAAQDEDPVAPLLEDEEEIPTIGATSRASTMPVDDQESPIQSPSKAHKAAPSIDRSFTTNFTEPPPQPELHDKQASEEVWPAASDDKTFGELLDREHNAENGSVREHGAAESWPTHIGTNELDQLVEYERAEPPQKLVEQDAAAQGLGEVAAPDAVPESALGENESNELDPSKFFGDDDEGLLEDEPFLSEPVQVQPSAPTQPIPRGSTNQYRPANTQQAQQAARQSPYSAPAPFINQSHGRAGGTPDTGLYDVYNNQPTQTTQAAPRPALQGAQSFADKSKGGYQSPYDLPMEVVKPRKKQVQQQPSVSAPAPPPRTSSYSQPAPSPAMPPQNAARPPSTSSFSPPTSSHGLSATAPRAASATANPKDTPGASSGFFADLPTTAKARARSAQVPTPQPTPSPALPQAMQPGMSAVVSGRQAQALSGMPQAQSLRGSVSAIQQSVQPQQQQATYGGLRQPDRMPLLPDQPTAAPTHPPPHTAPTRYSPSLQPAPGPSRYSPAPNPLSAQQSAPSKYPPTSAAQTTQPPTKRHASAAPVSGPPSIAAHQFAPRTSSPLAFAEKPHPPLPSDAHRGTATSPSKVNGITTTAAGSLSPERKVNRYSPSDPANIQQNTQPPPPRPWTQSPTASVKQANHAIPRAERPTSAAGGAPSGYASRPAAPAVQPPRGPALPHRRTFSLELTFAAPQDERAQDPLERWKGGPIFVWSAAGSVVTSFPKQTPFYASGQGMPNVKCTPGDVKIQDIASVLPLGEQDVKFPGPLPARSKGKKKDVLAWLSVKVENLEQSAEAASLDYTLSPDMQKRAEERVLLWKIMRLYVEHDGALEGNPKIDDEVRKILLPHLAQMNQVMELQSPTSATSAVTGEPIDRQVLAQLRQALLEGHRERAVWLAEDKKLWGHAMLIASTMAPETWKQIIQSFVRSQVKSVGPDGRSLATLYQIFAGNSEECVDELVPPSARAGFQMVSKTDGMASSNPLDGLDQWRETLGLVTSNRTSNDGPSILALGKLLTSYGRIEAAHTCFLFARTSPKYSGADDAEANFVLLGANHQSKDESFGSDLDAILLTEVYEWASSLSAPSVTGAYVPHLQSFKFLHAQQLAAYGMKTKAQSYCDHITQAYQSTTRPSQYYHPTFTQAVSDLSAFLSQTPQDAKSGWFGRPAMKTVSSNAGNWFTKFVSGDDDARGAANAAAGIAGTDESGPFGRVSGEVSRSASGSDLYGSVMMGGSMPQAAATPPSATFMPSTAPNGRYAPSYGAAQKTAAEHASGPRYTPQLSTGLSPVDGSAFTSPTEVTRNLGVPSFDNQRPSSAPRAPSFSRYAPGGTGAGLGVQSTGLNTQHSEIGRPSSDYGVPYGASDSRRGSAQDPGSQGSYVPTSSFAPQEDSPRLHPMPQQYPNSIAGSSDGFDGRPNGAHMHEDVGEHMADVPDATSTGYEPPTAGYEPPSYQPYQPEPEMEEPADESPKPKKKGIMDLDEDDSEMEKRAAAQQKAQADRQADEAFRKAAEADAARDKSKGQDKAGGTWFGGWFKKDPSAELNKPIKAKLGEESSFHYDEKLKKWVNKKGGMEEATPAAATPPPPRAPGSRAGSVAAGPPPSGPPSRVGSGVGSLPPSASFGPPGSGPPSRAGTPASFRSAGPDSASHPPPTMAGINADAAGSSSAPPSRPPTSMSNASSLDDLLAAGSGRRGASGTLKGKKKGRYVDVMAQ
ncbi:hypothetical protein BAUCODRAFT_490045 [Baudoinia panamericana UAMH 10762]|uniref:Protein transport protein sec16 n=1 Tax=Baudoinia panamericana (strain UAMH 10762) TaxID=717646 RepID=M2MYW0_BAUPA|nr:uncharacterized protein BAUCODRAFT_490045 [Baudoinia panamericana UAMH 10762]EMC96793.1 hypothetical protein BAUCODRAFT_490045 [Baudoinia panamericana UAMH 10762]